MKQLPAVLVLGVTLLLGADTEAGHPFNWGGELAGNSRYVWRGILLDDRPVIQPSVWFSARDFTLSVWSNFALAHPAGLGLNETDLGLSYSRELAGISFEPAFQVYLYPNQPDAPPSGELNLALARPFGPVTVSTGHALDVLRYPGSYFGDLGLAYERELAPNLVLGLESDLGWASARFNEVNLGVARAALDFVSGALSLDWQPAGLFSCRPHVGLSRVLDAGLRQAADVPTPVVFGVAVAKEF